MEALSEVVYLSESGLFCRKFINSYLYISVKKTGMRNYIKIMTELSKPLFFFNDFDFFSEFQFLPFKEIIFLSVRQCEQDPCIWVSIIMPGSSDV